MPLCALGPSCRVPLPDVYGCVLWSVLRPNVDGSTRFGRLGAGAAAGPLLGVYATVRFGAWCRCLCRALPINIYASSGVC